MKKKKTIILISVILIAVLLVSGFYVKGLSQSTSVKQDNQNYATFTVTKGNIRMSASGTGNIEPSVRKEIKNLDNGQIVDKLFVSQGETVTEGDLVLTFESDSTNSQIDQLELELAQQQSKLKDLQEELNNLKVYASISGFIGDINGEVGSDLSKGFLLTTIDDKSTYKISGLYNKTQIESMKIGDKATVTLPDSFYTIEGTVVKINKSPITRDSGAILYEAIVEVSNPGGLSESTRGIVLISNDNGNFKSIEDTYFVANTPQEVKLSIGGKLSKLYVSSGDYVEKGDLIAELESDDLLDSIESQETTIDKTKLELADKLETLDSTAVYAPIGGTVTQLNVTEGERVNSNSVMLVISDLNNLQVTVPVDELDINKVKIGQKAIVTAQALSDTTINGEVSDIALEGSIQNGVATYDVTISLEEVEGLKPGMSVNAEIIIEEKNDALLIPIEAIQVRGDNRFVLVDKGNDEPDMMPVTIGLVSEDYVEIVEGLEENDVIIYPITSTNSSNTQQNRMGLMGIGGSPQEMRRPTEGRN